MLMVEILEETKKYVVFKVPVSKKNAVLKSLIPEVEVTDKEKKRLKRIFAYNKKNKNKSLTLAEYRKKKKV